MNCEGLNPLTTNDEIASAGNDIYNAWNNVVDKANDWANANDNGVTKAHNHLDNAINALPGN